jgi:hypothetical protein
MSSYQPPPQLWRMELVRDRENSAIMTARLTLRSNVISSSAGNLSNFELQPHRHTYMPKVLVNFAGPSYFGGKNDELVLCAGKGIRRHPYLHFVTEAIDSKLATFIFGIKSQAHCCTMFERKLLAAT